MFRRQNNSLTTSSWLLCKPCLDFTVYIELFSWKDPPLLFLHHIYLVKRWKNPATHFSVTTLSLVQNAKEKSDNQVP